MPVKEFILKKDFCPICDAEVKGTRLVKLIAEIVVVINGKNHSVLKADTYHRHCIRSKFSEIISATK